MIDLKFKYKSLLDHLESESPFTPDLAIVLGSGLGDFAEKLSVIKTLDTNKIPGYPASSVEGHKGKIHFAQSGSKKVLLFQGRIHYYEGYQLSDCLIPILITKHLNVKKVLLTNAAGGINKSFSPGDLMLVTSFNGILLKKEITEILGIASLSGSHNFLDLPNPEFNSLIENVADKEFIELKKGVYFYAKGPSYETPAEIQLISKFGGDAVGMSTVHEAVYAAYKGIKTASISCITNLASGISETRLSHQEVTETANKVKDKFARLVLGIVNSI